MWIIQTSSDEENDLIFISSKDKEEDALVDFEEKLKKVRDDLKLIPQLTDKCEGISDCCCLVPSDWTIEDGFTKWCHLVDWREIDEDGFAWSDFN